MAGLNESLFEAIEQEDLQKVNHVLERIPLADLEPSRRISPAGVGGNALYCAIQRNEDPDISRALFNVCPGLLKSELPGNRMSIIHELAKKANFAPFIRDFVSIDEARIRGVANGTPLHVACSENTNADVVRALLEAEAAVDAVDDDGNTAMHSVATNENHKAAVQMAKILVNYEADLAKTNSAGNSALEEAKWKGNKSLVRYLKKANNRASKRARKGSDKPRGRLRQVMRRKKKGSGEKDSTHVDETTAHFSDVKEPDLGAVPKASKTSDNDLNSTEQDNRADSLKMTVNNADVKEESSAQDTQKASQEEQHVNHDETRVALLPDETTPDNNPQAHKMTRKLGKLCYFLLVFLLALAFVSAFLMGKWHNQLRQTQSTTKEEWENKANSASEDLPKVSVYGNLTEKESVGYEKVWKLQWQVRTNATPEYLSYIKLADVSNAAFIAPNVTQADAICEALGMNRTWRVSTKDSVRQFKMFFPLSFFMPTNEQHIVLVNETAVSYLHYDIKWVGYEHVSEVYMNNFEDFETLQVPEKRKAAVEKRINFSKVGKEDPMVHLLCEK